ncbi:MAG: hypothetical protein ABIO80_02200 [Sphingomicrobium sp.]
MALSYRLYRLDGAGKITAADWIDAFNDDDAVSAAREQCGDGRHELWERNRLVGEISRATPQP